MNKKLYLGLSSLALAMALSTTASADAVFEAHCVVCHAGGGNVMNKDKTLKMDSLKKNGVDNVDAIKMLVSKGKAPMPEFGSKLSDGEITGVANYVLDQAKKGW